MIRPLFSQRFSPLSVDSGLFLVSRAEDLLADEAVDLGDAVGLVVRACDPVDAAVLVVRGQPELLAELLDVRRLVDRLCEQELTVVRGRRRVAL